MKRVLAWIMMVAILLSFAGCGNQNNTGKTDTSGKYPLDEKRNEAVINDAGIGVTVIEVIHPIDDAPQIAGAVSVGIGEGAYEDLIKDICVAHVEITCLSSVVDHRFISLFVQLVLAGGILFACILCAAAGKAQQNGDHHNPR